MDLSKTEQNAKAAIIAEYNKLSQEARAIVTKELGWSEAHVWVDVVVALIFGLIIGHFV